jgi:hypothetical protein
VGKGDGVDRMWVGGSGQGGGEVGIGVDPREVRGGGRGGDVAAGICGGEGSGVHERREDEGVTTRQGSFGFRAQSC